MGEQKDQRVLILGAGGHAQVVADILSINHKIDSKYKVIGYLDDNQSKHNQAIEGVSILGSIKDYKKFSHDHVIVAIGDNKTRSELFNRLLEEGESFLNAIHPSSILSPNVKLGLGIVICGGVVVNTATELGNNVILNTGCTVDHHNIIKDHVHVAPGCTFGGDIKIGEGCLIGIGATVLPQIQIGAWSAIGAGAVVIENLPDHIVAVGMPARILKYKTE